MHGENIQAYGLWILVIINAALFVFFIFSFLMPMKKREWRSMGVTTAFFVALFTEMYGFPLTIYLLTGLLGNKYPALDPFSHANGHLWVTFFGGDVLAMNVIHVVSNGMVLFGFFIMWKGWKLVHSGSGELVTSGLYGYTRHPQYTGLFIVIVGMFIQWPSIATVIMAPVLVTVYYRLSRREEKEMIEYFGDKYREYMSRTPMFLPRFGQLCSSGKTNN